MTYSHRILLIVFELFKFAQVILAVFLIQDRPWSTNSKLSGIMNDIVTCKCHKNAVQNSTFVLSIDTCFDMAFWQTS